ncbi:MAG TPA: AAA family ATPase [Bryobacteraceae bacterium]|nr:AAA family ATPase [Bryobacteraceae bacterium]
MEPFANSTQHILAELHRLDRMLLRHVLRLRAAAAFTESDFRGLYVPDTVADGLLEDTPPADTPEIEELSAQIDALRHENCVRANDSTLLELAMRFELSQLESDAIVIALAPELDSRYEILYAYAQNDVTKKNPTVDLALKLLQGSLEERVAIRGIFEPTGTLLRNQILSVVPDAQNRDGPLLSRYVRLDPRAAAFLLGRNSLDWRLSTFTERIEPTLEWSDLCISEAAATRLKRSLQLERVLYWFEGPPGSGKQSAAEAICRQQNLSLMVVDLRRLPATDVPIAAYLRLEAILGNAAIYFDHCDALLESGPAGRDRLNQLIRELAACNRPIFLASAVPWQPELPRESRIIRFPFARPVLGDRRKLWQDHLAAAGVNGDTDPAALAGKFALGAAEIRRAVDDAGHAALLHAEGEPKITNGLLHEAARAQSSQTLRRLARKVECTQTWDDLILPPRTLAQLHEIERSIRHRELVYSRWGFEHKLTLGRGVNVLLSGQSGTGKTMAASIIARELGLDLYKIDLATVVSKYIGETEKNLAEIFHGAQTSNAIILFDEADALFGKRSEVKDAHDRYANIEIAYLLQRVEEYEGVVILSTNLSQNIDEAFARRMRHAVEFPFPEPAYRERIWRSLFPSLAPLDPGVDVAFLARQFELAGGNIRNIALAAAFFAADENSPIRMEHVIFGVERELQKIGKLPSRAEFREYYELIRQHR